MGYGGTAIADPSSSTWDSERSPSLSILISHSKPRNGKLGLDWHLTLVAQLLHSVPCSWFVMHSTETLSPTLGIRISTSSAMTSTCQSLRSVMTLHLTVFW